MSRFNVITGKEWDRSVGIGFRFYTHKHMENFPYHFHVLLNLGLWFIEFQFGRDVPKDMEEE